MQLATATGTRARRHGAEQQRVVSQCRDFGGEPGLMAERARKAGPSQMRARTKSYNATSEHEWKTSSGAHRGCGLLDAESCDSSGNAHAPVAARGEMAAKKIKRVWVFCGGAPW